jgi:polyphosphate kinase
MNPDDAATTEPGTHSTEQQPGGLQAGAPHNGDPQSSQQQPGDPQNGVPKPGDPQSGDPQSGDPQHDAPASTSAASAPGNLPAPSLGDAPASAPPAPIAIDPADPPHGATAPAPAEPTSPTSPDLGDEAYYFNRELSWLNFNERVLELAEGAGPAQNELLLERFKFAAIFCSNLDEFFMIRVAGLQDQVEAGVERRTPDGRTPLQAVTEVRERALGMVERLARCLNDSLIPELARHGVRISRVTELSDDQRAALSERFRAQIFPVLTPLAVGPGRPFPYISNLSLSIGVLLRDPQSDQTTIARVKVPKEGLPRFVELPEPTATAGQLPARVLVPLEDVIADNLELLFPGTEVLAFAPFRVTRDADFTISDEADD